MSTRAERRVFDPLPKTPPSKYAQAMGAAVHAAIEFAESAARFQNALDDLREATPHCDVCRWATDRGHSPNCRAAADLPIRPSDLY